MPQPTVSWPTELPAPLINGFQESEPKLTVGAITDIGPPKLRRRSNVGISIMQMSFLLNSEQLGIFRRFYQTDTLGGSLPWGFYHPREVDDMGRPKLVTLIFDTEQQPTWNAVSNRLWNVSFRAFRLVE